MREPLHSLREFPSTDVVGVLCGAGSALLHNNLGGRGGRDGDDASLLPDCDGRTQSDDCSKAMGAFNPSTQSPKGPGPASPCASRRACGSLRKRRRPCSALGPHGRRADRPVGRGHHGLQPCWGDKLPEGIKRRTHVWRDQRARARRREWAKQRGAHVYIQEARQSRRGHDPLDAVDLL